MPFCPNCRLEYVEAATRCDDCDVALVASLPPEPAQGDIHWQELPSFNTEAEGEMVQGALEDAGIRTMLKKDVFVSAFGGQGTVIFVPQERYEEAAGIRQAMVGD